MVGYQKILDISNCDFRLVVGTSLVGMGTDLVTILISKSQSSVILMPSLLDFSVWILAVIIELLLDKGLVFARLHFWEGFVGLGSVCLFPFFLHSTDSRRSSSPPSPTHRKLPFPSGISLPV